MSKAQDVFKAGQSIWIDYMRRQFVRGGELEKMVEGGVRGVTSNPTIFEKAIAGSADYDQQMKGLVEAGSSTDEIYEALVVQDIQEAADILRPVYDESGAADGYVSLEVSPSLARDTKATVAEARRLFAALERPNIMIKVPATVEGVPAIEELIGEGINVNVTLLFSLSHYEAVAEAYLKGLEKYMAAGGDLARVASVASFFVSRVDGKVDAALEKSGSPELRGKTAVANAKLAYARFTQLFSGDRWQALKAAGAHAQRPLWASTSVKNPEYPDTMYVDQLIGPNTVNTVPPETLEAFLDHGSTARSIDSELESARAHIEGLSARGIDLGCITEALQTEGVEKFADSFRSLTASIDEKRKRLRRDTGSES